MSQHRYTREYFEGGLSDGSGYKYVGLQNFPAQLIVLDKILERKPESLLDIGGSRGYVAHMFEQKTGKRAHCIDISEYVEATRVTNNFTRLDITADKLPFKDKEFDLAFSIAVLEHIKREDIGHVIKEISRVCKRGLLAPSFYDVGEPDHTHELLVSKEEWIKICNEYAPGWPVEIVDKEEMERGDSKFQTPKIVKANGQEWTIAGRYVDKDIETLSGKNDSRPIVLNISSYVVMFRSTEDICVINTDVPEITNLNLYAQNYGHNFTTYKAPGKLPFKDNSVSEINCSHMLEHLTREEGSQFLKECLRVLKPNGRIRIAVPDAYKIAEEFVNFDGKTLTHHGIYNIGVQNAEDSAQAFWHLITSSGEHRTAYDEFALKGMISRAGFYGCDADKFDDFCHTPLIGKVGWDMYAESSLYVSGWKESDNGSGEIVTSIVNTSRVAEPIPIAKIPANHTVKINFSEKEAKEQGFTLDKTDIQAGATVNQTVHKVAIISTPYIESPPQAYGGLELITHNLAKSLGKAGLDVTLIAPEGSKEDPNYTLFTTGKPTGMAVNWLEAEKDQSKMYKSLIENGNFDIIHDQTWFSRIYNFKKINPKQKIVHTHHGHLNPDWVQFVKEITPTPNLIAISNWMKRLYLAQYQIYSKVAHNGIDTDLYKYNPDVQVSNRLLFVGRIDRLKRPHIALDVAEKVGLPIDIVGSVDWSAHKEYAEQVIKRTEKLGGIVYREASTDKKIELMQKAKAVIVPSMFGEPFGLVVAESMSTGTPVIAMDDGGINEIMNGGFSYLGDNPNEMAEIVNDLDNLELSISRNIRANYIRDCFSLQNLANRHIELYNQVLAGKEW